MQDSINPESMDTHCLYHCISTMIRVVLVPLIWVEGDSLSRFVGHYFANSAILGKATITFLHLLDYTKLLALSDAAFAHGLSVIETAVVREILEFHVLQNY